jgi:DNA-binding CsgD family transcriptional regulator
LPAPAGGRLFERDEELGRLDSLLDAAAAGSGRLAVVEGPAGIGKTELLATVRGHAAERGMQVFRARGSDLEGEFAYGVVRQLFDHSLSGEAPEHDSLLSGVASHTVPVFAAPGGAAGPPESAGPSPTALLHGLFWLVANFAERGPLLLALDDAQWADAPSLRFLHYLGRRLDELPVAVVLAMKPVGWVQEVDLVRRISAEPEAAVMRLRPLSVEATRHLLGSLLAANADERFTAACHVATGGNPLLLRELAGALKEDGVAPTAGEAHRVERLVPDALSRHVLVRLSRLPPSAAALARAGAVLGGGAFRQAAVLAELDEATAAKAFDGLVSVDILAPAPLLEFVHPLLREVVYADIAPGERAVAHRRAARVLADAGAEPERTASQLLACEPAGAGWAVQILRAAARDAHARGATRSAVTYLARALREPPALELRASVMHELGLAETNEGLSEAPDHLAEALRLTPEWGGRAAIAPELAVALEYRGRSGEAVEVLEQTIEALGERRPDLRFRLEAQAVVAANTYLQSRRGLLGRVSRARAQLPSLNSPDAAPLLSALALEIAYRGDTAEEAVECTQRGLTANKRSSWIGGAVEVIVAAEALTLCDRLSHAQAICDELIGSARAHGATLVQSTALTLRARVLNSKGQILDAEADARLALELAANEPFDLLRPYKLSQLVEALIERGERSAASRLLTPAEMSRHEPDQTMFQLILRDTHARLLRLEGRLQEALAELHAIEQAVRDWGMRNPGRLAWRETSALIHHQLGDDERAAEIAEDELAAARLFGAQRALGIALRTAALLAAEDGIEQLREAVVILEASEARLEHARTLVELGAALRRAGYRADARDPLRTGLELADRCGARPLAQQARQELLATGARPRRPHSTGRDALTPSERRIATMAADGLTNREIAQALYLSLKTVEMHLSRAYRKLDIGSRAQLTDALASPSEGLSG